MLATKPERKQGDGKQDDYSEISGLDCSQDKDLARQEFKDEADINILLRRFGVGTPSRVPQFGGEYDFDIDLQKAKNAIAETQRAYNALPPNLKEKYKDWQTLLNAIQSGQLRIDMRQYQEEVKTEEKTTPVSPVS